MTDQEYIENRINEQIEWYGKQAANMKDKHTLCKQCEIACTASVPVLAMLANYYSRLNILIAIIGAIATFILNLHLFNKYHEKWMEYRKTCEALKQEKILYLTLSASYRTSQYPFTDFVEKCELIMNQEHNAWVEIHKLNSAQSSNSSTNS